MWNIGFTTAEGLYIVTDGIDVKVMRRLSTGVWQTAVHEDKWNNFGKVIAWMELPEPPSERFTSVETGHLSQTENSKDK